MYRTQIEVASSSGSPRSVQKQDAPPKRRSARLTERQRTKILEGLDLLLDRPSKTIRRRIWLFLEEPNSSFAAKCYAAIMICFICLNLLCGVLLSIKTHRGNMALLYIDFSIDIAFLCEVFIRFTFCPSFWRFWCNAYNVIDFLSVLPLIITLILQPSSVTHGAVDHGSFLNFVLVARPTLRLLRTTRHFSGFRLLIRAMMLSFEALAVALFMLIIVVIGAGCLLYFVEGGHNEEVKIKNIPTACWFALVTVSTVGYGQIIPITVAGKLICCFLIPSGVIYMAMPLAIVGKNFADVWNGRDLYLLVEKTRSRMSAMGLDYDSVYKLFDRVNVDNEGGISVREFKTFLGTIKISLSDERITSIFEAIDVDGNGDLTVDEFALFLFPHGRKDDGMPVGAKARVRSRINIASPLAGHSIDTSYQKRHRKVTVDVEDLSTKMGNILHHVAEMNRRTSIINNFLEMKNKPDE